MNWLNEELVNGAARSWCECNVRQVGCSDNIELDDICFIGRRGLKLSEKTKQRLLTSGERLCILLLIWRNALAGDIFCL
ncbi:hypothetical protein VNO78_26964 [Psophocarpus tetragonolobus]|uniref:Uncharacterized protein n=1 Tax=Psophocarpus tetragonolobus TaxID=3891 RepID=A0AAN9S0U5_PSOTE